MGFRLKTSERTKEIFEYLENRMKLQPFALSKIAIALSLNSDESIDNYEATDQRGLDLNRQTIMGNYDDVFKCLLENDLGRSLSDDEYFPHYTKKHLDRGAEILKNEYDYSGNYGRLFESLIKGRVNI